MALWVQCHLCALLPSPSPHIYVVYEGHFIPQSTTAVPAYWVGKCMAGHTKDKREQRPTMIVQLKPLPFRFSFSLLPTLFEIWSGWFFQVCVCVWGGGGKGAYLWLLGTLPFNASK